jgi:hypothetical protein
LGRSGAGMGVCQIELLSESGRNTIFEYSPLTVDGRSERWMMVPSLVSYLFGRPARRDLSTSALHSRPLPTGDMFPIDT